MQKKALQKLPTVRGSRVRAVCQKMLEMSLLNEESMRLAKGKRCKKSKARSFAMKRRFIAQQVEALYVELSGNLPDQLGLSKTKRARILVHAVDELMRTGI